MAKKLKSFCDTYRHEVQIDLHAVGHSAGSIFHAHFIPTACDLGVPSFRTVHFLAPALRVDAFHKRLASRLGKEKGIEHLAIFTMNNSRERADNCAEIYRKSLLYLIYYALEPDPKTPLLGLEISLRNDPKLRDLFGLGAVRAELGEVVWSPTLLEVGRSASRSIHHGDFDDDAPTMNSIARHVLGADDNDPIQNYPTEPAGARGPSAWNDQIDWPEEMAFLFAAGEQGTTPTLTSPLVQPAVSVPVTLPALPTPHVTTDGAFVVDDDIGAIFEQIPPGVNVTCFIDCCHSGTISRFGVGTPSAADARSQGLLPRFIVATPQMIAAHQQFRQRVGRRRTVGRRGLRDASQINHPKWKCLTEDT